MNKEQFIERAKQVHGDKYDYSKVEYINNKTNICIVCPVHGEFWQTPKNHLKGCHCPKCAGHYTMTTSEFIEKSIQIHGNKYDYNNVVYKNYKYKVNIICPEHGEFCQLPGNHLKGEGCIKCRNVEMAKNRADTIDQFIEKAKLVHGDKYDYSKVNYINNSTKICIICPEHGEFWQTPANHINLKQGCPKCYKLKRIKKNKETTFIDRKQIFIDKCKRLYGDKYDYSKVNYINTETKVCIICPVHGEFYKKPSKFLQGQVCPRCTIEQRKNKILEHKYEFIEKANKIHNNKYDYNQINYLGSQEKIGIICHEQDKNGKEHGIFWQLPSAHIRGNGCPKCASIKRLLKQTKTTEQFIKEAKTIYPEYDYSKTEYQGQNIPVTITCHKKYKNGKEHGDFKVVPNKLLTRHSGCPHCNKFSSKPEQYIYEFIVNLIGDKNIERHNRTILNGKEIDIYIPSLKIGIEFDGLIWHSIKNNRIDKNTHIEKTNQCEKLGIHLIHIFSDEFFYNKEIVLNRLRHIINKTETTKKIYGRKCSIKEIDYKTAKVFLEHNCIGEIKKSSVYIGAYFKDELVTVVSFVKRNKQEYLINNIVNNYEYIYSGVVSRVINFFTKKHTPKKIIAFADRRWCYNKSNMFEKIGFINNGIIRPDYMYINTKESSNRLRINKYHFKNKKNDMTYYSRVYDCGKIRYILEL